MVCFARNMAHKSIWNLLLCLSGQNLNLQSYVRNYVLRCHFIGFEAFLAISRIKQFKLGLFCTKLGTQNYLAYIIVLKLLEFKILVIFWKLRVKFRFFGFLIFLGTFANKVAQTWCVLQESRHTTLFGIQYYVEVVRIENHTHML